VHLRKAGRSQLQAVVGLLVFKMRFEEEKYTWAKLPVWKPHHTKIAEKEITSLGSRKLIDKDMRNPA